MLKTPHPSIMAIKPAQQKSPAAKPVAVPQATAILQERMERRPAPAFQPGRNLIRAGVVQRQVTQEPIDRFLKGKKLTKFRSMNVESLGPG